MGPVPIRASLPFGELLKATAYGRGLLLQQYHYPSFQLCPRSVWHRYNVGLMDAGRSSGSSSRIVERSTANAGCSWW
jgi:hypothetical protein